MEYATPGFTQATSYRLVVTCARRTVRPQILTPGHIFQPDSADMRHLMVNFDCFTIINPNFQNLNLPISELTRTYLQENDARDFFGLERRCFSGSRCSEMTCSRLMSGGVDSGGSVCDSRHRFNE